MTTAQANLMTAEELINLPRGQHRYELIKGELLTMSPSGGEHGITVVRLTSRLNSYVEQKDLGFVFGAETGFKLGSAPDTVLAPDISFVLKERLNKIPTGFVTVAPDLVVEVLSPGERPGRVRQKTTHWLSFGAKSVWLVDPKTKTVETVAANGERQTFRDSDLLFSEVIPGFNILVSELFLSS